jgi:uncharacterized protein YkwD
MTNKKLFNKKNLNFKIIFSALIKKGKRSIRFIQNIPKWVLAVPKQILHLPKYILKPKNQVISRIIVIAFFLGLNIVLLPYFLQTNNFKLPERMANFLQDYIGEGGRDILKTLIPPEPSLDPQIIILKLNFQRNQEKLDGFIHSKKLDTVAQKLLLEIEDNDYELDGIDYSESLRLALSEVGYDYSHVIHNTLLGPTLEDDVVGIWLGSADDRRTLFEEDFTEIGLATKIVDDGNGIFGLVVQILAKPQSQSGSGTQNTVKILATPIVFPEISNQSVLDALNTYRSVHGARQLSEHPNLCQYAEKRVQDLVAFGGLDNHEGFKRDFEDPENIPQSIRDYPGNQIAENLAYQYCKNMTTGDSFIAETGTALIEWCFDSSTAGHREAQLDNDFRNACVRQANNLYVIIFGN